MYFCSFIDPKSEQIYMTPNDQLQFIMEKLIKERELSGNEFGIWITIDSNGDYQRISTSSDILSDIISFLKGENNWDTEINIIYNIWCCDKRFTPDIVQRRMDNYKQEFKRMIKGGLHKFKDLKI